MKRETYIGDGVYASFDGYAITLWTDRSENGRNWMEIDPHMLRNIQKFYDESTKEIIGDAH